jgi:hypothetical protein
MSTPRYTKAEAGALGARNRWGPPRILRLDQLDPITAEIVRAIVTARENAKAAPASETPGAAMETSGASRRRPTAA